MVFPNSTDLSPLLGRPDDKSVGSCDTAMQPGNTRSTGDTFQLMAAVRLQKFDAVSPRLNGCATSDPTLDTVAVGHQPDALLAG